MLAEEHRGGGGGKEEEEAKYGMSRKEFEHFRPDLAPFSNQVIVIFLVFLL